MVFLGFLEKSPWQNRDHFTQFGQYISKIPLLWNGIDIQNSNFN